MDIRDDIGASLKMEDDKPPHTWAFTRENYEQVDGMGYPIFRQTQTIDY